MTNISKLDEFRRDPDTYLKELKLPYGKTTLRQVLNADGLTIRIQKIKCVKAPLIRYRKDYYYSKGGQIVAKIGSIDDLTYRQATKKLYEVRAEALDPQDPKKLKITLKDVFDEYVASSTLGCGSRTIEKKGIAFNKLQKYANMPAKYLKLEHILEIAQASYTRNEFSALRDFSSFIGQFLAFALRRKYISSDPLNGEKLTAHFVLGKKGEYPWIDSDEDLRALCLYVSNYPDTASVRNALVFRLCTGLRPGNIRNLATKHLRIDENGEYFLFFEAEEMKIEANGDVYIGLPCELGDWLQSITRNGLYFPSRKNTLLSDAVLSKALRKCPLSGIKPRGKTSIVCHSFRKILSTFVNEADTNGISDYDVERALAHRVGGMAGRYNKSKAIATTRRVLTWWLSYLQERGLKL